MIDTSVIRPECLYESAEACELCGRSDVKSFIAAIVRAGYKPSHEGRCKLWQGTTLLAFLGVAEQRPAVPYVSHEEACRNVRQLRTRKRSKAVA